MRQPSRGAVAEDSTVRSSSRAPERARPPRRTVALGIDIGTTSTKAVAVDRSGEVVAAHSAKHGLWDGAGVVETPPHRWWETTCTAVRALSDVLPDVGVIGLCGNMSSTVLLDDAGQALRPAILLADSRGAEEIDRLPPHVRSEIENAGHNRPGTVFTLAKLLWLAAHEPETLRAAKVLLTAKDYVRYRLTGTWETEPTDAANTLLLDPAAPAWRTDLIDRLHLPRAIFPPLVASDALTGAVTAAASSATGLPVGTPVQAGMGDMAAAMLGAHDPGPETVLVSLGTSVTVLACVSDFAPRWRGRLTHHPLPRGMGNIALGSLLTGGLAVDWVRSLAGDQALHDADSIPDPHSPLVFLPHLAGAGTPQFRPTARGTLFGLEPGTTGPHLARALYEGTAFEIADTLALLDSAGTGRVLLAGGGVHLTPWVRILTDVLDRPTEVLRHPDTSAIGAARLAWRTLDVDNPAPGVLHRLTPRHEHRSAWQHRRRQYQAARRTAFDHYAQHPPGNPSKSPMSG